MPVIPYAAIRKLKLGQTLSKQDVRLLKTTKIVRYNAIRLASKA